METLSLDINPQIVESKVSESDIDDAKPSLMESLPSALPSILPSGLPEEMLGLHLANTKQKDDCLYLYSRDRQSDSATKILEAIALSTRDLQSSILFAEGIRRLKLHGHFWALGVDLPIAEAAVIAAAVIADLRDKLPEVRLKLLLQSHCLNLLCETRNAMLQAEVALPILDTLRKLRAAAYFQAVTVSHRSLGTRQPNWSFEIDLLAIGEAQPDRDIDNSGIADPALRLDLPLLADGYDGSLADDQEIQEQSWHRRVTEVLGDRLRHFGKLVQPVVQLQWLGKQQESNSRTISEPISIPVGLISLAIGVAMTFAIDRLLSYQSQLQSDRSSASSQLSLPVSGNLAEPVGKETINQTAPNQNKSKYVAKIEQKPTLNFNIAALNEKLLLIDWHITQKQRSPDVMIVGSSRALRGIEPSTLEQSLAKKGYKNISVFNFGIDGATAQVVNIQITQILERPQLPRMIIWADGLRAFNSKRSDITYDEITASVGYKQIQEKLKNQNNAPLSPNITASTSPANPMTQAIAQVFATSNKRQVIRESVVKTFDRHTQALSNSESLIAANAPKTSNILDPKGFVTFDVVFDPSSYFQKYPLVPGDYDLDYRNFETTGAQFDAFSNVVEFCRRNNIQLVVVNMPLHETYLDQIRQTYEATFNDRLMELAKREGFLYLNLSQTLATQSALFSDPSHLNKQGAIAIAQALAQNPQIPWQSLVTGSIKK